MINFKYYLEKPVPFLRTIGMDENPVNHHSRLLVVEEGAEPDDDSYIMAYVVDYDKEDTVHSVYLECDCKEITLNEFKTIAGDYLQNIPSIYWDEEAEE